MHPNKVQFVDLLRQYHDLQPEMDAAILRAVGRGDFILGEDVREFEKEFAVFNEAPHCIGVADGTRCAASRVARARRRAG